MSFTPFGRVVTVDTYSPFVRVVMGLFLMDFPEALATADTADCLSHSKHPTWLEVNTYYTSRVYIYPSGISREERGPAPSEALARQGSTSRASPLPMS
jgi:hypothetical protein